MIEPEEAIIFGQGETILLADNDASLLKLGHALLSRLNYQVVTASNEKQVIERFTTPGQKIDLAILDTQIPKQDGQDILNQIRFHQPKTKAIFYTVCDWLIDSSCQKKIAHEPLITKPYSVSGLSKIIYQTLH